MRRAVPFLLLAAFSLPLLPGSAHAQKPAGLINAIGLIDFGHKPDFHVGSWATYHVTSENLTGGHDDYTMTVLIAGEENWWGEDCFWVETTTKGAIGGVTAVASLMSYDVFNDSLPLERMQYYVRKIVNGVDESGLPVQEVYKRPPTTLKAREMIHPTFHLQIDTVGTETIQLDKGTFACTKVRFTQGRSQTGSGASARDEDSPQRKAAADSTDYTELRETRTSFMSPKVPITHIAREDIDQSLKRKAWKIGKSSDATPLVTLDDTKGAAVLVDYGENGKSQLLPPSMQKSLAELRVQPAPAPVGRHTVPRRSTTKKPG